MQASHVPLKWQWHSQKGAERRENRDACGLFANTTTSFAVIMDASEKGENGQAFNAQWSKFLIEALGRYASGPTSEHVLEEMRRAQITLRPPAFLLETACFCALLIRHDLERMWIFACGDCRIGVERDEQNVDWLSPVHSMANMYGEAFTIEHAVSDERHRVTRCLKARSFAMPDVLEVQFEPASTWRLATDGYWVDQLIGDLDKTPFDDDRSLLRLGRSLEPMCATDSDNVFVAGTDKPTLLVTKGCCVG